MKSNSTSLIPSVILLSGIVLTLIAGRLLDIEPKKANLLAIRKSGYGMTLARLSQDTVNRVWHIGIEEVEPHDHHESCDCSHCNHGNDEHHGHEHAEPKGCECAHCSHGNEHDHAHHGHDHEECAICSLRAPKPPAPGVVERAHNHLKDLQRAKTKRTSKYSLTERHKLTTSRQIENTLRKSYEMDPTNYGVYSSYHLFLTIHNLGATEKGKQKAEAISRKTIWEAFKEDENPEAYLTAASAALNLFFSEQARFKNEDRQFSRRELVNHGGLIKDCLQQYDRIKQQREIEGTWNQIPEARRAEIIERARFARKTHEQFGVMLSRMRDRKPTEPATSLVNNKNTKVEGGNDE